MKKGLFCKGFVLGIILLFVGNTDIQSSIGIIEEKIVSKGFGSRGYIQDLIDNASNGDTIYIPSGTYYENIIINKSISLIGEDKNTTIIDGDKYNRDVIFIVSDYVNISGFTIQNSGGSWYGDSGIKINSNHTTITGNNINLNKTYGISIHRSNSNNITGNTITDNKYYGIYLEDSSENIIVGNIILNNEYGICLEKSSSNNITGNTFTNNSYYGIGLSGPGNTITGNNISLNNEYGILLFASSGTNIIVNTISKNKQGIYLFLSRNNTILKNNFQENQQDAFFNQSINNKWKQNYWNRTQILPKLIFGRVGINSLIPWVNIDWRPARKPYDTGGVMANA